VKLKIECIEACGKFGEIRYAGLALSDDVDREKEVFVAIPGQQFLVGGMCWGVGGGGNSRAA
jgi:hypothetical protein